MARFHYFGNQCAIIYWSQKVDQLFRIEGTEIEEKETLTPLPLNAFKNFLNSRYYTLPANLAPTLKAFSQSFGNISLRLCAFFSGSKRSETTFE